MPAPRVFISYSSRDVRDAERLESLLSRHFKVWRDKARIESDWSRDIANALATKAEVVCLLWSRPASESSWVRHEWVTARALEKWVVPYRLADAPDLPPPLQSLDFIPAPDTDGLVRRIAALGSKDAPARYDFTVLPPAVFVPFRPNPGFRGRRDDFVSLYLNIVGNLHKTGTNQAGLVGLGGSGKTQLASEFAYRFAHSFSSVHWIDATEETAWGTKLVAVAKRVLGADRCATDDPSACLQDLREYWLSHPGALLIMDNVADPVRLNSEETLGAGIAPLSLAPNLLFTTRQRFSLGGVSEQIVDMLPADAAFALLADGRPPSNTEEAEAARDICDAVGRLPLAIVLVSGSLRIVPRSYSAYRALLSERGLRAIDLSDVRPEELATRHRAAVHETLLQQFEALTDPVARDLFRMAGLLPESGIVHEALLGLLTGVAEADGGAELVARAFGRLRMSMLMQEVADANAGRLHPLVHEFAEALTPEGERAGTRREAAVRLVSALERPDGLEPQIRALGADEVIEELGLASAWAPEDERAALMRGILEREYPNLQPSSLLQQVHYRASAMGLEDVARRFADAAVEAEVPILRCVIFGELDDASLTRSFAVPGFVTCMASGRGGNQVAVGTSKELGLWDASNRLRRLKTAAASPMACWFHGNEPRFLVDSPLHGYRSSTIEIRGLDSDQPLAVLRRRWDRLRLVMRRFCAPAAAVCSASGRYAFVSYRDQFVAAWDLAAGKQLSSHGMPGHFPSLIAAFNADESAAAAVLGKRLVWWTFQPESVQRQMGDPHRLRALVVTPDGATLVGAADNGLLLLWDVSSGRIVGFGHSDIHVTRLCLSPDGTRLLGSLEDNSISLWRREDTRLELLARLKGHAGDVTAMAFIAHGRALTGSRDGRLIEWDLEQAERTRPHRNAGGPPTGVWCAPDGKSVVSATRGGLSVWDVGTGNRLRTISSGSPAATIGAHDGRGRLLTGSWGEYEMHLWDITSGERIGELVARPFAPHPEFRPHDNPRLNDAVRSLCVNRDGSRAVSGGWAGELRLWDLENVVPSGTRPLRHFPNDRGLLTRHGRPQGHNGPVEACCFDRGGSRLLSGGSDGDTILWDVDTGRELRRFEWGRYSIAAVCFAADEREVVGVNLLGGVRRWNVDSEELLAEDEMLCGPVVFSISFDERGERALLASEAGLSWIDLARTDRRACLSFKGRTIGMQWRGATVAVATDPGGVQVFEVVPSIGVDRRLD